MQWKMQLLIKLKKYSIKMIDQFLEFLIKAIINTVQSYWGGVFFIIVGIFSTRSSMRNPTRMYNIRGWIAAVGFIILGVSIIILKIAGKL